MNRRTFLGSVLGLLLGGAVVRQALEVTDTERLMAMVNRKRLSRDLRLVRTDVRLTHTAQDHADHMADVQSLHHSAIRLPAGARWEGEIIGVGDTLHAVVVAWMHSPEHRVILLEPKARFAGAGTAFDERWWMVVQFAY